MSVPKSQCVLHARFIKVYEELGCKVVGPYVTTIEVKMYNKVFSSNIFLKASIKTFLLFYS